MKKILLILIIALTTIICTIPFASAAYADNGHVGFNTDGYASRSAYLLDFDTGTVLLDKKSDDKYPIASMVKIMTLLMTFNEIDAGRMSLEEEITISDYAASMGGSQMFLDAGKNYPVSDLIKGVTVCSANDAATALGERVSGDIGSFVGKMNEYARSIGMNNTVFCNATGLPNSGEQYSTAKDVSIMFRKLLEKESYYKFSTIWIENYNHPDGRVTEMVNTNKLIRFYDGCDAGKTGFTDEAMFCLAASAKKNGMRIVGVVLGAKDSKNRFREMTDMFNYAFANYEVRTILKSGETIPQKIEVKKAKEDNIEIFVDRDIKFFTRKGNVNGYNVNIVINEDLKAPISKDTSLGKVILTDDKGASICEGNIYSVSDIEKLNYVDSLERVLNKWLRK